MGEVTSVEFITVVVFDVIKTLALKFVELETHGRNEME